jgi:protein O-mannosyl-transferase
MAKKIQGNKSSVSSNSNTNSVAEKNINNTSSLWPLWAALGITALIYLPSLSNGFVNWDDDVNILENMNLKVFDWESIKGIFTSTVIGNYNPLPILTFAIERWLFDMPFPPTQENAQIFHTTNLILHLVNVFLIFRVGKALGLSVMASGILALLFGIHPMRVESVAWITERKDVLMGVFFWWALLKYIQYINSGFVKKYLWMSLMIFVVALFSKIQAVALPLSFLAVDYLKNRPLKLNLIIEKIPFFIFSLIVGLLGIYFLAENKSLDDPTNFNFFQRLLVGALSYVTYIVKAIVPYRMSPLYPYPQNLNWQFYLAPIGVLGVAYLAWRAWKNNQRALVFAIAFFTFNVMFLLQILAAGQGFLADRFTYIAYFGLFYLAAYYYDRAVETKSNISFFNIGLPIFFGLSALISFQQIKVWEDGISLWTHVLKYYKDTATPWGNRGMWYRDKSKLIPEAIADFNEAIRINPKKGNYHNSRGKLYFDQGKVDLAMKDYNIAISLDATEAEYFINRGAAYATISQFDKALVDFNKGLALKPENLNGLLNRSLYYQQTQQYALALTDYDTYLKLDPSNSDMMYEKGLALRGLGREKEALDILNQAINLKNSQPLFFVERAKCHLALGNIPAGRADLQVAKSLGFTQFHPSLIPHLQ